MSRTYRCRHLPMVRRRYCPTARRISDGANGPSRLERRQAAEAAVGPKPEPQLRLVKAKGLTHTHYVYPLPRTPGDWKLGVKVTERGAWMKTQEYWEWEQAVDAFENEVVLPIASWHPWQRHGPAIGRKKAERVYANRAARHVANQTLRSQNIDEDWEGHFPGRRDYFNWWNIY